MATATDPVIDLTTPRARRIVKMDSGTYRFRSVYDLTIEETQKVDRLLPQFLELAMKGYGRSAKESKAFTQMCDDICRLSLLEGDAKVAGPAGRAVLADFFLDLCLQNNLRLQQVRDTMNAETKRAERGGTSLSPTLSGSTAGRRASGSRKPH